MCAKPTQKTPDGVWRLTQLRQRCHGFVSRGPKKRSILLGTVLAVVIGPNGPAVQDVARGRAAPARRLSSRSGAVVGAALPPAAREASPASLYDDVRASRAEARRPTAPC